MIEILIINILFLILSFSIFEASEFLGGISAPFGGCFLLKQSKINNGQVSRFRERRGVPKELRQYLALFIICLNSLELNMLHSKSARAKLESKLAILSVAVTAAISKIVEVEGIQSLNAKGIKIAFDEFTTELNQFVEKHSLFPDNEEKIHLASRKLNYQFNHLLNGVIESVNILPRQERLN